MTQILMAQFAWRPPKPHKSLPLYSLALFDSMSRMVTFPPRFSEVKCDLISMSATLSSESPLPLELALTECVLGFLAYLTTLSS